MCRSKPDLLEKPKIITHEEFVRLLSRDPTLATPIRNATKVIQYEETDVN